LAFEIPVSTKHPTIVVVTPKKCRILPANIQFFAESLMKSAKNEHLPQEGGHVRKPCRTSGSETTLLMGKIGTLGDLP
jgi:hypothetical protein